MNSYNQLIEQVNGFNKILNNTVKLLQLSCQCKQSKTQESNQNTRKEKKNQRIRKERPGLYQNGTFITVGGTILNGLDEKRISMKRPIKNLTRVWLEPRLKTCIITPFLFWKKNPLIRYFMSVQMALSNLVTKKLSMICWY